MGCSVKFNKRLRILRFCLFFSFGVWGNKLSREWRTRNKSRIWEESFTLKNKEAITLDTSLTTTILFRALFLPLLLLSFSGQVNWLDTWYWNQLLTTSSSSPVIDDSDQYAAHQPMQSRPPSQAYFTHS